MKIRKANEKDVIRLCNLVDQLGYPSEIQKIKTRLMTILSKKDHALFVVDHQTGILAGWIHVFNKYLLVSEPMAEIGGLIVDEKQRSKGFGRALLKRAEDWSREQGNILIRVPSNTLRSDAVDFYKNMGYKITKTQNIFFKQL